MMSLVSPKSILPKSRDVMSNPGKSPPKKKINGKQPKSKPVSWHSTNKRRAIVRPRRKPGIVECVRLTAHDDENPADFFWILAIRMFPKIVGTPKSSNFNRVFHYVHHPFWGTLIFGNIHKKFEVFFCVVSNEKTAPNRMVISSMDYYLEDHPRTCKWVFP